MQKNTNDLHITKLKEFSDGEIFFIQRILEMLDAKTVTSYSIKYLNSHFALKELFEVCEKTLDNTFKHNHLKPLTDEVRQIFLNDSTIHQYAPAYKNIIAKNLDSVSTQTTSLYRVMYQVKHVASCLESKYLTWLIIHLKKVISENNKEIINEVCNYMINELINRGWSAKALLKETQKLSHDPSYKLDNFFSYIKKNKEPFTCLFQLQVNTLNQSELDVLEKANVQVQTGALLKAKYNIPALNTMLKDRVFYVIEEITVYDPYSAMDLCWEQIIEKYDTLKFYGYKTPDLFTSPFTFVAEKPTVFSNIEVSLFEKPSLNKASKNLFEQFLNLERKKDPNTKKIKKAFEYIRMSNESLSMETKFLNLWVALESFVKTIQYESIIENVKTVVPNIITSQYIYRLLRNFHEDCRRCNVTFDFDDTSLNPYKIVEELLCLLLDTTRSSTLISKCEQTNTLLAFRCKQIIDIVNSPTKVLKSLQNQYQKVQWHLQRLYRLRNEIVHTAQINTNLNLFYTHLHDYIQIIITDTIFRLERFNYSTIEEVYAASIDNYNATIENLRNIKPSDDIQAYTNLLLNGALFSL